MSVTYMLLRLRRERSACPSGVPLDEDYLPFGPRVEIVAALSASDSIETAPDWTGAPQLWLISDKYKSELCLIGDPVTCIAVDGIDWYELRPVAKALANCRPMMIFTDAGCYDP